mgnify:FL=1
MTEKEALEFFEGFIKTAPVNPYTQSAKLAIKALERQIPKKPYDVDTERKTFDCPECLSTLYINKDMRDCGYCCICGQALDWSDET